ncbi:unnamed protein product [Heterobilharzia americana]|nr:unnamed protein product [Heterobilharzia americana]
MYAVGQECATIRENRNTLNNPAHICEVGVEPRLLCELMILSGCPHFRGWDRASKSDFLSSLLPQEKQHQHGTAGHPMGIPCYCHTLVQLALQLHPGTTVKA